RTVNGIGWQQSGRKRRTIKALANRLKVALQIYLLRERPTTLGEAFSLARLIEAHFEAIIEKDKQQIIKKKADTILSLQSELASPEVKGSLDVDEHIGVNEVSSVIDGVLDSEVVVSGGKALGVDEDKPYRVISVLKDRGGEFDERLDEINLDLSQQFNIRALEGRDVSGKKSRKAVEGGRGKRVLASAVEDGTTLFLEPQYLPSSILVLVLLLINEHGIPESRMFLDNTLRARSNPTTLDEAFSLARAAEARFTNQQLWERLRSYLLTLGEAFFRACITEAHFKDENNQAVDTNIGDPGVKDKQEVKKANAQEIENIKDEERKIVEDQQVFEADDDTNNDNFGCSLPPYKGVYLTLEEVVFENIKSDLKKDEDEQGVFNDVGGVRYSKVDGKWEPSRRIEDGWYLFDELRSKLYFDYSIKNIPQLSDDKHADYDKKHKREIQRRIWNPIIKRIFKTSP
nr:hypothetical protein [Tanacetum cinerariifolium]